jgi:hypothetical protein
VSRVITVITALQVRQVLLIQYRATRRSTIVVSRDMTIGVINRNGSVHTDTKSRQWTIYTKVPSPEEQRFSCKQG